ncbi:hypothetical protein CRPA7_34730 [Pseudomonas aeruginosa]
MTCQALHGRSLEQVGGIGEFGVHALFRFVGVQGQVELRAVRAPREVLDAQPRQLRRQRLATCGTQVLVVVHGLEQRAVAETALRLQSLDQLLERQVLM